MSVHRDEDCVCCQVAREDFYDHTATIRLLRDEIARLRVALAKVGEDTGKALMGWPWRQGQ